MNASEVRVDFSGDSITLLAHINLRAGENASHTLTHAAVWACVSLTLLNHLLSDPSTEYRIYLY